MPNFLFVLAAIVLTQVSWGVYGPLIRTSTADMHGNHLLPFILVGVAYFAIAVVVPIVLLRTRGEKGEWSARGILWSFSAGVSAAIGALGIILAFHNGGSSLLVMPLVFGGAPVVNTFYSMYISKTYREVSPIFYAGLILVVAGAACVLAFNPAIKSAPPPEAAAVEAPADTAPAAEPPAPEPTKLQRAEAKAVNTAIVLAFVALTIVTWGIYGPILHNGQAAMAGSRLRPFLCVGLAYFLIAVIVPVILLVIRGEGFGFTASGTLWGLLGGGVGALGALGIILAFTYGGKPIYVMPLTFGGAPVINTLTSMMMVNDLGPISPLFYAGMIVVIAGSAVVLVFAPKPPAHAK